MWKPVNQKACFGLIFQFSHCFYAFWLTAFCTWITCKSVWIIFHLMLFYMLWLTDFCTRIMCACHPFLVLLTFMHFGWLNSAQKNGEYILVLFMHFVALFSMPELLANLRMQKSIRMYVMMITPCTWGVLSWSTSCFNEVIYMGGFKLELLHVLMRLSCNKVKQVNQ